MVLLALFLLDFVYILYHGVLLSVMWNWFIMSGLHAHEMSFGVGCGIVVMIAFLRPKKLDTDEEIEDIVKRQFLCAAAELVIFGMGALVHWMQSW